MSFIDDMKVGKKLMGGFIIILLILVCVSVIGYVNLQDAAARSTAMYEDALVPIQYMAKIDANGEKARGDIYRFIYVADSRTDMRKSIEAAFTENDELMDKYRSANLNADQKAAVAEFDAAWPKMKDGYRQLMKDAEAGNMDAVNAALLATSPTIQARTATFAAVDKISTTSADNAKSLNDQAAASAASASMMMIIATFIAIIAGLAIALYLSKSITGPLDQASRNMQEMSMGHLGNRLKMNRKDEIGEMAEVMDKFSDDLQMQVVGAMKKIADGDLSVEVKAKDAHDEIGPALQTTIASLRALVAEANMLSKEAVAGQLSTRGNADKFKGGYREVIVGINQTLDGVVAPVNEAMRVSNDYASGNFTARFDEKLNVQGDFIKFKDALNNIGVQVSKALTAVNQQVGDLAASAEEANASVEEVSAGSAQVAKNASGVSINAEKATEGVHQVQKAMEDLSRTIQDVATKSEVVAKIVQDTTTFSKEGMELAQKTEQGMQGITKSSNDVNHIIGEIKSQMDKISEIVNLITDLANQTNLLALNAAIEAARAGDAGRGFAVVATEVKSLAVESRASAERISEMIDNLQKQTLDAVDAVTASNNGVKEGSAALQETLSSFNKIVAAIDKISQNVSEVAAAAEEQAASVEEVTASVNEVGGLMQNTTREATDAAAASEESSAAIDQITKVVANVNTIVDKVTKEVSKFRV